MKLKLMKKSKKLMIIAMLLATSIATSAREILPEFYVMSRVLMLMKDAPRFLLDGKTVRGLMIDQHVMDALESMESPFYMETSGGVILTIRAGDYFVSPMILSSIGVVERQDFEATYTPVEDGFQFQQGDVELAPVDYTAADESK